MNIRLLFTGFLLLFALAVPNAPGARAQLTEQALQTQIEIWERSFDQAKQTIDRPGVLDEELRNAAKQLRRTRDQALELRDRNRVRLDKERSLLDVLGEPPAEGAPAEDAKIAELRRQLGANVAFYSGRVVQADLTATRADDLVDQTNEMLTVQLWERLLEQRRAPLHPDALRAASSEFNDDLAKLVEIPVTWWRSGQLQSHWQASLLTIALAFAASILVGWPLRRWLVGRFGRKESIARPSYTRRMFAAVTEAFAEGLFPALAALAVLLAILWGQVVSGAFADLLTGVIAAVIFLTLTFAMINAALAPEEPRWRIWPFGDREALTLSRRLHLLAIVAAYMVFNQWGRQAIQPGLAFQDLEDLVLNSVVAILILTLLQRRLWPSIEGRRWTDDDDAEVSQRRALLWRLVRLAVALAAIAIPIAALMGYPLLANHLTTNLVISGILLAVFIFGCALLNEAAAVVFERDKGLANYVRRSLALNKQAAKSLQHWLVVLVEFVVALLGLWVVLSSWGLTGPGLKAWLEGFQRGVTWGDFTISPADIAFAVAVFVVLYAITRALQWFIAERLLPKRRADAGVRESLRNVIGYVGMTVAAVAAVVAAGFDLSNLAIVAGALSVGIGFGLQNVVNNFVSGLILLAERPIKVGDWVVVGGQQGYVKSISVRATEIETFQRASVIVPNSEIISTSVVNWTHKDMQGRVEVPVGVAYGSNTERVRELLIETTRHHDMIRQDPEPYVVFVRFGDSSLDFELRCFIHDVNYVLSTASDLRFAIDKAFRENGIEIPFPQRDLHLKETDELARALSRQGAAADRDAAASARAQPEPMPKRPAAKPPSDAADAPETDEPRRPIPKLAAKD